MTAPAAPAPLLGATPVAVAALGLAAMTGVALAISVPAGLALVAAACFVPLAFINLSAAMALWLPLIFLAAVPALNAAGKAAGVLLAVAWLGTARHPETVAAIAGVLRRHRRAFIALVMLLLWLSASMLWADNPGRVLSDVWHWYVLAVVLLVISTTLRTPKHVRLVIGAFVVGAVLSVLLGFAQGGLASAGGPGARLEGGAGDPNFLAASLVAAIVLAAALGAATADPVVRALLVGSIPLMATGLVASQSRGGMLAAVATVAIAFLVFKRRRHYVVAFALVGVGVAIVWFSTSPAAWERVSSFDNGGTGRSALWTVAWRIAQDHPVAGVGLNNFREVAPSYVREPGALEDVRLVAEHPHFVHNMYLQVLAESGIVGFVLFMVFALGCVRAAALAARRFEMLGDHSMEMLARGVFVAGVSMLIAAFFLSSEIDQRLWALFALGPALLAVSVRTRDIGAS